MERVVRVAVAGAVGKLGSVAHAAFAHAAGFEYAGGLARASAPDRQIVDSLDELLARGPDVLIDATTLPASYEISLAAAERGVRPVIATSGWSAQQREALAAAVERRGIGAMLVPNFSLGAVLMIRFAQQAARFFPGAEIVEMHRVEKKDKPSGTALLTAEAMVRGGGVEPSIHSVRLPGLVAHQEVLFGGAAELLTIRHDSFSRESFVPGMLAAARAVMDVRGLVVGLDAVIPQ